MTKWGIPSRTCPVRLGRDSPPRFGTVAALLVVVSRFRVSLGRIHISRAQAPPDWRLQRSPARFVPASQLGYHFASRAAQVRRRSLGGAIGVASQWKGDSLDGQRERLLRRPATVATVADRMVSHSVWGFPPRRIRCLGKVSTRQPASRSSRFSRLTSCALRSSSV